VKGGSRRQSECCYDAEEDCRGKERREDSNADLPAPPWLGRVPGQYDTKGLSAGD
jgi:hypothetical protein